MSNADRLRSGPGLPMSDRLVDIGPVEQHAPSASSQPSPTRPCQWIRRGTIRYTQQGVAFQNSNSAPPDSSRVTHFEIKIVPTSVLRTFIVRHRLPKIPLHGTGAPHRAPTSVRTFTSAAKMRQTQVPSDMVVCCQHKKPTTNPPLNLKTDPYPPSSYYKPVLINIFSNSNLPSTYKHELLRDRPAHAHTADHYNPRSRLAGHPLAPFIILPQPPQDAQDLGTTLEPSHGRGL
jgi:hypothetical protein